MAGEERARKERRDTSILAGEGIGNTAAVGIRNVGIRCWFCVCFLLINGLIVRVVSRVCIGFGWTRASQAGPIK